LAKKLFQAGVCRRALIVLDCTIFDLWPRLQSARSLATEEQLVDAGDCLLVFEEVTLSTRWINEAIVLALAAPQAAGLTVADQIERVPLPPIRFREDTAARLHVAAPAKLYALCGRRLAIGKVLLGCASQAPEQLFLSNPCLSREQPWAREMCHEIGHVNGWAPGNEAVKVGKALPSPPLRFRGDTDARVHFAEPSELYALCGVKLEVGKVLLGCARYTPVQLFLSNPCLSLEQLYAKEACHELGHLNGWTERHEE
jgi:hypothetical protein